MFAHDCRANRRVARDLSAHADKRRSIRATRRQPDDLLPFDQPDIRALDLQNVDGFFADGIQHAFHVEHGVDRLADATQRRREPFAVNRFLEQARVFDGDGRQVRYTRNQRQLLLETERFGQFAAHVQRAQHTTTRHQRHDQAGTFAALAPGFEVFVIGRAIHVGQVVDLRQRVPVSKTRRRILRCDWRTLLHKHVAAHVRRNADHVKRRLGAVQQAHAHPRERDHLLQTARNAPDNLVNVKRRGNRFHHFVDAGFLLRGSLRFLVQSRIFDSRRCLHCEQFDRPHRLFCGRLIVGGRVHRDDADQTAAILPVQRQINGIFGIPRRIGIAGFRG